MEISKFMKTVLEMAGVEEPLEEMAYPTNFSFVELDSMRTFAERKRYCEERLQQIGVGSSRIAYKVDNEKVLKLAKNKKGIAQNEHEADWGRNNYGVFGEIFEADIDNYFWIEMELASKAKPSDFKRILGVTWKETQDLVKYCWEQVKGEELFYSTPVEALYEKLVVNEESDFFSSLQRYMFDYAPWSVIDWTRISNWGIVNRNNKEHLVIIDDGLDELIFKTYYMGGRR